MDWKADLYRKVAPHLGEHAIFASNTSGLSINKLAEAHPGGVCATGSAAFTSSIRRATCISSS